MFRECNYTGRAVAGGAAAEAVGGIEAADEAVREALLAMGGEDVEEVVVAKELLYFALSVFKASEHNICCKSWVRICRSCLVRGGDSRNSIFSRFNGGSCGAS